jgi:hypothetical protein
MRGIESEKLVVYRIIEREITTTSSCQISRNHCNIATIVRNATLSVRVRSGYMWLLCGSQSKIQSELQKFEILLVWEDISVIKVGETK